MHRFDDEAFLKVDVRKTFICASNISMLLDDVLSGMLLKQLKGVARSSWVTYHVFVNASIYLRGPLANWNNVKAIIVLFNILLRRHVKVYFTLTANSIKTSRDFKMLNYLLMRKYFRRHFLPYTQLNIVQSHEKSAFNWTLSSGVVKVNGDPKTGIRKWSNWFDVTKKCHNPNVLPTLYNVNENASL